MSSKAPVNRSEVEILDKIIQDPMQEAFRKFGSIFKKKNPELRGSQFMKLMATEWHKSGKLDYTNTCNENQGKSLDEILAILSDMWSK